MNTSLPLIAFFDLDGTLANKNEPPAQTDVDAIRAFRRNGNYAFLCTGRSRGYLYDAVTDIGFDGIVCGAGTYVTVGDTVLYRTCVDDQTLDRALHAFENVPFTLIMETERTMVQLVGDGSAKVVPAYPRILSADDWHTRYADETVSKFTVYGAPLPPALLAVFDGYGIIEHATYYEMVPLGCSKSSGIRRVIEHLDLPQENVLAFGDSPNDRDMIEFAGYGVVMGDGDPSVKAIADFVTLPLADCGVAHALSHIMANYKST